MGDSTGGGEEVVGDTASSQGGVGAEGGLNVGGFWS